MSLREEVGYYVGVALLAWPHIVIAFIAGFILGSLTN